MQNDVSLEDIKQYLRLTNVNDDNMLMSIKYGVIIFVQNYLRRGDLDDVFESLPADLKISILDHIAFLYDNRGSNTDLPKRILSCYQKYRKISLF